MKRRSFKANVRSDPKEILSVFHFVANSSVSSSDLVLLESFYVPIKISPRWHERVLQPSVRISWRDVWLYEFNMSGVTVQPANWFLWVGFCSLGQIFFYKIFPAQRGATNNITKTHTQFCLVVITHNTLLAMEISGSLQGPGYQVLLFHLLMQTAPEQKRMLVVVVGGGGWGVKKGSEVVFAP